MTDALLIGGPASRKRIPGKHRADHLITVRIADVDYRYRYFRTTLTLAGAPLRLYRFEAIAPEETEALLPYAIKNAEGIRIQQQLHALAQAA